MITEETLQKLEARLHNPRYANVQGQIATIIVTPTELQDLIVCARKVLENEDGK